MPSRDLVQRHPPRGAGSRPHKVERSPDQRALRMHSTILSEHAITTAVACKLHLRAETSFLMALSPLSVLLWLCLGCAVQPSAVRSGHECQTPTCRPQPSSHRFGASSLGHGPKASRHPPRGVLAIRLTPPPVGLPARLSRHRW